MLAAIMMPSVKFEALSCGQALSAGIEACSTPPVPVIEFDPVPSVRIVHKEINRMKAGRKLNNPVAPVNFVHVLIGDGTPCRPPFQIATVLVSIALDPQPRCP